MAVELQELVKAGVYPDADAAIQDALRVLWQERPAVRIEVAVHRYRTEGLSIAKAAALAGVSFDRMEEMAGFAFYDGIERHVTPFAPDGWLHLVAPTDDELRLSTFLPASLHRGHYHSPTTDLRQILP